MASEAIRSSQLREMPPAENVTAAEGIASSTDRQTIDRR